MTIGGGGLLVGTTALVVGTTALVVGTTLVGQPLPDRVESPSDHQAGQCRSRDEQGVHPRNVPDGHRGDGDRDAGGTRMPAAGRRPTAVGR